MVVKIFTFYIFVQIVSIFAYIKQEKNSERKINGRKVKWKQSNLCGIYRYNILIFPTHWVFPQLTLLFRSHYDRSHDISITMQFGVMFISSESFILLKKQNKTNM